MRCKVSEKFFGTRNSDKKIMFRKQNSRKRRSESMFVTEGKKVYSYEDVGTKNIIGTCCVSIIIIPGIEICQSQKVSHGKKLSRLIDLVAEF